MEPRKRKDFFIVKYILFLKNFGVPPLLSSIAFGGLFLSTAAIFYAIRATTVSLGYLCSLSWLAIGPFLIYKARPMVDGLWSDMTKILGKEEVEELQSYESDFYSYRFLFVAVPLAIVACLASILAIASTLKFSSSLSLAYASFFVVSWITLALVGSIGVWGVAQLIRLILAIRRYNLKLDPLSFDRFGGMKFLADFGIKGTAMYSSGALLIPIMIEIATQSGLYREIAQVVVAYSGLYALSVLLSFLVQVFALHIAAVKGRNDILKLTSGQYQKLLADYEKEPSSDIGLRILVLQGLFEETLQMKVYPFDLGIVLKLIGSIALPIVLGTINFWFPWIPMH